MSLDHFDRLTLFVDLLSAHPAVFVVERSVEPPKPLDPAVSGVIDDRARAFFERTSSFRFWWFLEQERKYESPHDYRPGAMGGFIHLVTPELPDLVFDRRPDGAARFEPERGLTSYWGEDGPAATLGFFDRYLQFACHAAFAVDWQTKNGDDSPMHHARRSLVGSELAAPVDVHGNRPFERPAVNPDARVKSLMARGATEEQARSLVEWLRDDVALVGG